MRTLKKTLCLVLALVLCFGLVGTAFAGNFDKYTDAETVGEAYKEAVDVMMGVGIIDGLNATTLAPQGAYTREQAAKIVAFMKLGKTAAEALNTAAAPFKDVAADRWSAGYIAYCAQEGIIKGYGDGKFGPTDTLTGYQWGAMLLRAVGYGVNGEYEGASWSIAVAKDAIPLGIFAGDLAGAVNENITREQAILYAFNTFTGVDKVSYSTLLGTYVGNASGFGTALTARTLAESVYNLYSDWDYVSYAPLTGSAIPVFQIDGIAVEADTDDVHLPYVVWFTYNNGKYTAVSDIYARYKVLGTSNKGLAWSQMTTPGATFVASIDYPTYYVDNADGTYTQPGNPVAGTKVTFIDTDWNNGNGDGKADIVLVQNETVAVLSADAYTVGTGATQTITIPGTSVTNARAASVVAPTGLKKGDVVTVQVKADGKTYVALAETVVGSLTNITTNSFGTTYTIAGAAYTAGVDMTLNSVAGYVDNTSLGNALLNVPGTFYKDAEGYIVGFKADTTPLYDLAWVVGTESSSSFGIASNQARLLFADGTTKDVAVTKVVKGANTYSNVPGSFGTLADGMALLADAGVGKALVQYVAGAFGYELYIMADTKIDVDYINKATTITGGYVVDSKTIFFYQNPVTRAWSTFVGAANIPTFEGAGNNVTVYTLNGVVMAMGFGGATSTATQTKYYGVVTAIDTSKAAMNIVKVTVFGKDGENTYEINAGYTPNLKDVIEYTIGTDGKISAVAKTATANIAFAGAENYISDGSGILPQAADIAAVYVPLFGAPYVGAVAETTAVGGANYSLAYVVYNVVPGVGNVSVAQIIYVAQPVIPE